MTVCVRQDDVEGNYEDLLLSSSVVSFLGVKRQRCFRKDLRALLEVSSGTFLSLLGIRCLFRKDLVVSCTCLNTVHIGDDGLHSCRTYRVVGGQVYEGHEEFTIGLNREGFLLRAWRE